MASEMAVRLRRRVEAYLGRGLTIKQVKHCEELIINFKPDIPLRYLEGLSKILHEDRRSMRNWGMFYFPLLALAQEFKGFTRRPELIFLKGRAGRLYRQCDLLGGEGFGEKDLAAILFLINDCAESEITYTFTIARTYGLRTLRHLRGIILKNRAVAIRAYFRSFKEQDEEMKAAIVHWAESTYPNVSGLQELYRRKGVHLMRGKSKMRFVWDELKELTEEAFDGKEPTAEN